MSSRIATSAWPGEQLSRRERQVAWLIGQGLMSREAAERLGVSHYTIQRHLANATIKLGAKNRTHLVWLAFLTGQFAEQSAQVDLTSSFQPPSATIRGTENPRSSP